MGGGIIFSCKLLKFWIITFFLPFWTSMLILVMCKTFQQAFISSDLVYLCIQLYSCNFEPRGRQFLIDVPYLAGISYDLILTNFIQLCHLSVSSRKQDGLFSTTRVWDRTQNFQWTKYFLINALIHSVLYPMDQ